MRAFLLWTGRVQTIAAVLIMVILSAPPSVRILGDRLQVALPLLAWACAGSRGEGLDFFVRYVAMFGLAHGSKAALGDAPMNLRPNGGTAGMPSAHTSTAVLGASRLAMSCLSAHPVAQGAVILSAVFVGGSRVQANAHSPVQVVAGAALGFACDRALRNRRDPSRTAAAWLRRRLAALTPALAARRIRRAN